MSTNVRRLQHCLPATATIALGLLWLLASSCDALGLPGAAGGQMLAPASLSAEATALVSRAVSQWPAHELGDGRLIDPVLGPVAGTYGTTMIGQVIVEVGADGGDLTGGPPNQALIVDGLRAEVSETVRPNDGGFELLALSDAFAWNERHLSSNPAWQATRPALAVFLSAHGGLVSSYGGVCYSNPGCYDNLKLVAGVADVVLLSTSLTGPTPATLLYRRSALRRRALALLSQAAANTGDDARRIGDRVSFAGAGILSDPPANPLAYHALSTMMLGHALAALDRAAPRRVRVAFFRSTQALVGLMAPDGNVAYIGRGQGQVWTVAATVDALSIAAARTKSPRWRGRYLVGAQLALRRLQALYPVASWGLALVPRPVDDAGSGNYEGIDGYANVLTYNGLALWALTDAARALSRLPATLVQPVPSTTNGVFLDPSHTKFAAVTDGNLWFAIHGTDSNPADARYGFGLVAAEERTRTGWESILPYPPLTFTPTPGGPALLLGSRVLVPIGRRITARASGGVAITGRWGISARTAPRRSDTVWRYRPTAAGKGVTLTFVAKPRQRYQFEVWFALGSHLAASSAGLTVKEPGGFSRSYMLNGPVSVSFVSRVYHSAYTLSLASALITVGPLVRRRLINYTTTFSPPG